MKMFEEINKEVEEIIKDKKSRIESVKNELDLWVELGIPCFEGEDNQATKMLDSAKIYIQLMKFYEEESSKESSKWIIVDAAKGYYFVKVSNDSRRNQILKEAE